MDMYLGTNYKHDKSRLRLPLTVTARGISSSYRYDSSLGIGSIPGLCMWPLAYMARTEDRSDIDRASDYLDNSG